MIDNLTLFSAFAAGVISFIAPCIIPMLPAYFAWQLKISKDEVAKKDVRSKIFLHSLLLVAGFSIFFIILGASASVMGQWLTEYRLALQVMGGIVVLILGLEYVGLFNLLKKTKTELVGKIFKGLNSKTSSLIIGLTFALAWTACFSPILGSILVLASTQQTLWSGVGYLSVYSIGLAIPFLLASFFLGAAVSLANKYKKLVKILNITAGIVLIITGLLLISDKFYLIYVWLSKIY